MNDEGKRLAKICSLSQ